MTMYLRCPCSTFLDLAVKPCQQLGNFHSILSSTPITFSTRSPPSSSTSGWEVVFKFCSVDAFCLDWNCWLTSGLSRLNSHIYGTTSVSTLDHHSHRSVQQEARHFHWLSLLPIPAWMRFNCPLTSSDLFGLPFSFCCTHCGNKNSSS